MNKDEIWDFINETKENELFSISLNAGLYAISFFKSDEQFIRKCLPVITSLYRKVNKPKKAIEIAEFFLKTMSNKIASGVLFTSLAAAYCDIEEYEIALNLANRAYAISGFSGELSNVYGRIQKKI